MDVCIGGEVTNDSLAHRYVIFPLPFTAMYEHARPTFNSLSRAVEVVNINGDTLRPDPNLARDIRVTEELIGYMRAHPYILDYATAVEWWEAKLVLLNFMVKWEREINLK